MKHLASIQVEFLKMSNVWWDRLSLEEQKRYLRDHPKSKRRLTGTSGAKEKCQHQYFHEKPSKPRPSLWKKYNDKTHEWEYSSKEQKPGPKWLKTDRAIKGVHSSMVPIREKLQRKEESELARPWTDKWLDADDYHELMSASTNLHKGAEYTVKEPFEIYQMTKTEANPNDMIGTAARHKMWIQKSDVKTGDKLVADSYSNAVFLNDDREHPLFINKPHIPTYQEYPINKLEKS